LKIQWDKYSKQYLTLSARDQWLLFITGMVVLGMAFFTFFVEENLAAKAKKNKERIQLTSVNSVMAKKIIKLDNTLVIDPNITINKQINTHKKKLLEVDERLFKLTSDLINPIEMRHALLELLKLEKSVKLVTFQAMPVQAIWLDKSVKNEPFDEKISSSDTPVSLGLYRHSILLVLEGQYFDLRDYLSQIENLSWTFFWQRFDYQLVEYPVGRLSIEIYSLSTTPDFLGV
jgi:MSHA biogenesis protein MshJ